METSKSLKRQTTELTSVGYYLFLEYITKTQVRDG